MKKFLLFILLSPLTLNAQEKYFHELRGLEDSTGTTHLFYRIYEEYDLNGSCGTDWENNVYHLNTLSQQDSVLFEAFYKSSRCLQFEDNAENTFDFYFLENDLNKIYRSDFRNGPYYNSFGTVTAFNGSFFDAGGFPVQHLYIGVTDSSKVAILGIDDYEYPITVFVTMENDSLPSEYYDRALLVKAEDHCYEYQSFFCAASDSLKISDYNLKGLNPNTNRIFLQRNDSLFFSYNFGDSSYFLNDEFTWSEFDQFIFSPDSITIMAFTKNSFLGEKRNKYQIIRSFDAGETWRPLLTEEWRMLEGDTTRIFPSDFLTSELGASWDFYAGAGKSLYYWNQLPSAFYQTYTFDSQVTGVYIKSDAIWGDETVYVLTKKELFEYKHGKATSLKKLPVSTEEPANIPSSVKLHQNYPNPFNPSTSISYALKENSFVKLTVYDMLGQEIQTLVNEYQKMGNHTVRFDARELSSGIYFYQLIAYDIPVTLTKRMTFIK